MWAGGVENTVFNYYREIDKSKFQFDFYYDADSTIEPPQELIDMGARFFKLPPYQQIFKYVPNLFRFMKKEKYSIVHSHLNTLSVFPLFTAWVAGVRVRVAHNHSVPGGNEWKRNAIKKVLKYFSKLFATDYCACSEVAGRWLFGDKSFNQGEVTVFKNAIDYNRFHLINAGESDCLKRSMGIGKQFVVGHIGRFTYAKNHTFLLDIFEEIKKYNRDAILLLVGDGELYDTITSSIEKRGLKDSTLLLGQKQHTEKYYAAMNVMIMPSFFEGLSMATVESQACGVPVVISEAIPEEAIVSDGCVYMSLSASPKEWADKAISLCSKELRYTERYTEYNIKNAIVKLETFYNEKLQ